MNAAFGGSFRKNVMVTDLDLSDAQAAASPRDTHHRKAHRKRPNEKTVLTMSGNFDGRSRSAEGKLNERKEQNARNIKVNSYFNELLQTKDKQMEQLLQRLGTLHKFNEQFAEENRKLREDVGTLDERTLMLRKQIEDCAQCRKLSQQLENSSMENKTLATDVSMMKTLVYRLNVQIEKYQDQLRSLNEFNTSSTAEQSQQRASSIPQWQDGLHTHTLAPLLQSYDEMIFDKEQLIEQYRNEFDHFTGELKRALEENNRLLQQNEAMKREESQWREDRTRLKAQLNVCRSKVEAQTQKSDLAREKLLEVMQCYEQKVQSLVLELEHVQSAYARCKSELASQKTLTAQPPQGTIADSLQECKELLEQLKTEHNKEKQKLEKAFDELSDQHRSTTARCEYLKHENAKLLQKLDVQSEQVEELRRQNGSLQRTIEKLKQSYDRLKARLRISMQWTKKLEDGQANLQNKYEAVQRLETLLKHRESQMRGINERHAQEIDKLQRKLTQKEDTIRTILRGKLNSVTAPVAN